MVKLLIIADDFTGALDTGVAFSSVGIKTKVIVDNHLEVKQDENNEVLVIDAETRHLDAEAAGGIVYDIVAEAVKAGIAYIYKKTDSALRGNIGSELTQAMKAAGEKAMPFIPAFPKMNRITRDGIIYIDGAPVSKSVFGVDPFEPVTKDSVKDIVGLQCDTPVVEISKNRRQECFEEGILVYDACSDEDIREIASVIKEQKRCRLMAGCAGFGAVLTGLLGLTGGEKPRQELPGKLVVVCGSVNPITRRQLEYGHRIGYEKRNLTPEQKLYEEYWDKEEGEAFLADVPDKLEKSDCYIIDSNDLPGNEGVMAYADKQNISLEEVRVRISTTMGKVAMKLLDKDIPAVYLVTGGDTLLGLMHQIGANELVPVGEVAPGSVLTKLAYRNKIFYIITKSGGFGNEELLEEIVNQLKDSECETTVA